MANLEKTAKSNSYFAVLTKRYDYYRNKIVKGFTKIIFLPLIVKLFWRIV